MSLEPCWGAFQRRSPWSFLSLEVALSTLRYRHQLFKVGTDTEGQSVMVKLKYYLEYLATNR